MMSLRTGLSRSWKTLPKLTCKSLTAVRFSSNVAEAQERAGQRTSLKRELIQRIKISGPMSIAEYMKIVLTHPVFGFYMNAQEKFGAEGHFTTNPEISQIFGEMIAIWLINQWNMAGSPKPFRIIELGPGRGTLAADISRVLSKILPTKDDVSLHLIEISPYLKQIQEKTVCGATSLKEGDRQSSHQSVTQMGIPVSWYRHLEQLPLKSGFNAFVAHEFFDALPIHKFVKDANNDWREVLVDYDDKEDLRFVLSRAAPTHEGVLFLKGPRDMLHLKQVEISPESGFVADRIMDRLNTPNTSGCLLICDYGYFDAPSTYETATRDTFRAFKNHKPWDPLKEPGTADLTADVNFNYILEKVKSKSLYYGPVTQKYFLKTMGIDLRLERLIDACKTQKEKDDLRSETNKVVNEMGEKFKFFSLFPTSSRQFYASHPPVGFTRYGWEYGYQ